MEIMEILSKGRIGNAGRGTYGEDIDAVNNKLFMTTDKDEKAEYLLEWIKHNQPCMLGRMASSKSNNLKVTVYVVDDEDLAHGEEFVERYLQSCRRNWKRDCAGGRSDAVLYFFNLEKLVDMQPSKELVSVFKWMSGVIFHEYCPVNTDVIYTEAVPLYSGGRLYLYKAGINFFHTTAHNTANHDRRIPGGAVISINSVGHYANNLVNLGQATDLDSAIERIKKLAWRSIGNGGISLEKRVSTSWHNIDKENTCPLHQHPKGLPTDFSTKNYSAFYHTDVLIPERLTSFITTVDDPDIEKWRWLTIEYFTSKYQQLGSIDFGMFHGYPVDDEAMFFNPFPPIRALNSPDLVY